MRRDNRHYGLTSQGILSKREDGLRYLSHRTHAMGRPSDLVNWKVISVLSNSQLSHQTISCRSISENRV